MCWNPKYVILMAISTIITYISGIFIEKSSLHGKFLVKKLWLVESIASNLAILGLFKYADFFLRNLNKIMMYFGFGVIEKKFDILLPVGISFYTFQALGYTLDVYRGDIKAEKNIFKYALFVSFFPQLVAGPIERSSNLLAQIQKIETIKVWNFDRIREGFLLIMWGLFQKLVIADRAALLVNTVIRNYQNYGFFEIVLAMILFAFQIYCDFGGYTSIARGAAQIMGFSLMNNFRQPYLAKNIKEFWRRWHISLTTWFTDYLYIPLGGGRRGRIKKYFNIVVVFGISGLWHGASWNFIMWGLMHAFYQISEDCMGEILKKWNIQEKSTLTFSSKLRKIVGNFFLVCFAWILFISNSTRHALAIIKQLFSKFQTTNIYKIGLNRGNWFILIFALSILLLVDILHEKKVSVFEIVNKQEFWFRWILYLGLVLMIIMFGIYGSAYDTSTFIYFQF